MSKKFNTMLGCLLIICTLLTGCLSGVWTGSTVIYNRNTLYKQLSDFQLGANANRALYHDKLFKCANCILDVAVQNGDILVAGHLPTEVLKIEAVNRIRALHGYRRLFIQLAVGPLPDNRLRDNWITAKIRSKITANSKIDPHAFKVVTSDLIVYLMGDVIPEQANEVIHMARTCASVKRVVTLFKYYNLSDQPTH